VALAALAVTELQKRALVDHAPDAAAGSARAFLPGRFQVLRAGARVVVLDVGHNPEALHATLDVLEAVLPGARPVVVLGLLRDKKLNGVGERLSRLAERVILTAPRLERAWDPVAARALFPPGPAARCSVEPHVPDAVGRAFDGGTGPLLVLGSHYLLGEAVPVLAARLGTTPEQLLAPAARQAS
jgi:dihydrofolate synthase/folylpolyglutamate synthase